MLSYFNAAIINQFFFYFRGPSSQNRSSNSVSYTNAGPPDRLAQVRTQIDDVTNVMRENMTKVLDRGERLDELRDRSGNILTDI